VNLEDWGASLKGDLSLRAQATHYIKNVTDDGVTAIDQAGANTGSTPDWVYRLSALYKLDDWTFSLTARGVSSGVISNAYTECASSCPTLKPPYYTINDNHIDGAMFWDLSIARKFEVASARGEAYVAVKNLFNKDPPLVASPASLGAENTVGYVQTNRTLYDVLGTVVRVGVRLEY
jgi:outer membrane receptor protein involved in Fe transport